MSINHVKVVSVPVSDQDRAKAFYVDTLGFELRTDAVMGHSQRWVEVAPPGKDVAHARHLVRDNAARLNERDGPRDR